eukprot:SAG11_NODE_13854_length_636_cov_1.011173_1_plen_88_part_00
MAFQASFTTPRAHWQLHNDDCMAWDASLRHEYKVWESGVAERSFEAAAAVHASHLLAERAMSRGMRGEVIHAYAVILPLQACSYYAP